MLVAYTMIGTRDVEKASAFYDAVLAPLGAVRNATYTSEKRTWYQTGASPAGMLAVGQPFEGEASGGNGTMVALMARSTDVVHQVHQIALGLGATNEGDPGARSDGSWYGAYFRDADGNKVAVFTMVRPS
jgi:catechol 2,3-dioxygenase-like lactoylglutathione lyase family enzyme